MPLVQSIYIKKLGMGEDKVCLPWWRFGFALLIGALIGLEREYYQ